jgi:transglutaminase-like putative cysteine protease
MKNLPSSTRWWDWPAIGLLFILLQTAVARLLATEWTDYLSFTQILASMGLVIGLALGYSRFHVKTTRWLSFGYMIVILPLIWIRAIDPQVDLEERLASVSGRLFTSITQLFANKPIKDPLFFVAIMCVTFWIIGASAGFQLTRKQNFIFAVIPASIGILVIQHYDNTLPGRLWLLGFFAFIALCLLGRLNFLQNQQTWRTNRVFLSPENNVDLSSSMAIAAGAIIIATLLLPSKLPRVETIRETWRQLIRPWTEFTNEMENAVSALDSTSPGTPTSFYGTELELGLGFTLSDALMFRVQAPELGFDQKPPRYYWRGRTYDYFSNGQWYTTGTSRSDFSPLENSVSVAAPINGIRSRFIFTLGTSQSALLYAPAQPIWFSRPGSYLSTPVDDIFSWNTSPTLQPGETYQVDAVINNPHVEELREAGTDYPQWITDTYLQLPEDFSPRIQDLAREIATGQETNYDKAVAITRYLRENIEYASVIPEPPRRADPLEWVIFESKQAYCVYYATSEILMLRSLGIPARMAVGFSQGELNTAITTGETDDTSIAIYTVLKKNAHAWPEVFFPGIGWVEFEPTGNQTQLIRPFLPNELDTANTPFINRNLPQEEDSAIRDPEPDKAADQTSQLDSRLTPTLYLILFLIIFAPLTIFITRRYNIPARVPTLMRTAIERTGIETPPWIIHWERWVALSPIERSFESINIALRRIKRPQPIHATPVERAEILAIALPNLQPVIKVLLDEHQTSLYTSRVADETKARQAAFRIRTQSLLSLIRRLITGRYTSTGT